MNKQIEKCGHCGAKMIYYTHSLESGSLPQALIKFFNATAKGTKEIHPLKAGLTVNQYNNFQKLSYWGLVERTGHHGKYRMTYHGIEFIYGRDSVCPKVVTYRGEFKTFEGSPKPIYFIKGFEYMKSQDYLNQSENVSGSQLKFEV